MLHRSAIPNKTLINLSLCLFKMLCLFPTMEEWFCTASQDQRLPYLC